jgi:hypothetical protein
LRLSRSIRPPTLGLLHAGDQRSLLRYCHGFAERAERLRQVAEELRTQRNLKDRYPERHRRELGRLRQERDLPRVPGEGE